MKDNEFNLFRELILNVCGILIKETKKDFLRLRINRLMETKNISDYTEYYKFITENKKTDELHAFIDSILINETFFFRNTPQFALFTKKVLPEISERKRKSGDFTLKIWSAGCATGEEPYSIAISVLETLPDKRLWDIKIMASDVSKRCIQTAERALYTRAKLQYAPEDYIKKYFRLENNFFGVKEEIKKLVSFRHYNLKHENGISDMDVIFCRNVLMYFELDEQKKIIEKLDGSLQHEGYLFLGHAESLSGISGDGFKFVYSENGTAYKKTARNLSLQPSLAES
jgi:chemotaxis protein methyltransferase CheR